MSARLAAQVGTLLAVLLLGSLVFPYAVLDGGEITVYYGVGPVSPLFLLVLPAVTAVALTGMLRGRSDPALAAGASLAISALLLLFVGLWVVEVGDIVGGLTVPPSFEYHRWVLLGGSLGLGLTALVFAWQTLSTDVPQRP
jgi:hypothetical protein